MEFFKDITLLILLLGIMFCSGLNIHLVIALFLDIFRHLKLKKQKPELKSVITNIIPKYVSFRHVTLSIYPSIPLKGDFHSFMRRGGAYLQEIMHFEALRLKSFSSITMRTSYVGLASAGFYATGRGDETRCYSCGIRHRDWQSSDKPRHADHKPHCMHIHGTDPRNVPYVDNPIPIQNAVPRFRHDIRSDHDLHPPDVPMRQIAACPEVPEMDLRFKILDTTSYDGILLWKIRNYSRHKQEAVRGHTLSLYSQPFYTSKFGYKMCARAHLNGDGEGKSTHVSLFFVVMRGQVDSLLPWPFQQKVMFSILDQGSGRRHIQDHFLPDPASSSFRRPQSEMNIASGYPTFVSHSVLENPTSNYLEDDTVFIRIAVDTTHLRPL